MYVYSTLFTAYKYITYPYQCINNTYICVFLHRRRIKFWVESTWWWVQMFISIQNWHPVWLWASAVISHSDWCCGLYVHSGLQLSDAIGAFSEPWVSVLAVSRSRIFISHWSTSPKWRGTCRARQRLRFCSKTQRAADASCILRHYRYTPDLYSNQTCRKQDNVL